VAQQPKSSLGRLVVEVSRLHTDTRTRTHHAHMRAHTDTRSHSHTRTPTHRHARTRAHEHTHTHIHPITLLWTIDQLVAVSASHRTNTIDEHPCLQQDSNPALPAIDRLQNYTVERTASWRGYVPLFKFILFTFALITRITVYYRI